MKRMRITVNGVTYEVEVEVLDEEEEPAGGAPPPSVVRPRSSEVHGAAPTPAAAPPAESADAKALTSPLSGIVVEIKVVAGAMVKENDPVLIVEAMKMNTTISSPMAGRVRTIVARVGEAVRQGQVLLTFD